MKRYRLVGLALVAMFALFVVVAPSALAEETLTFLLANWLINSLAFSGELEATLAGESELKSSTDGAVLVCSDLLDGILRESAKFEILLFLDLAGQEITELNGFASLCVSLKTCEPSESDIEVWPLNLPWLLQADLMEPGGMFVWLLSGTSNGSPAYHVSCLILGIKVEEECTFKGNSEGVEEGTEEILNVTGSVEVMGEVTPAGDCGGSTGNALDVNLGGNLLTPNEGGTLSVSSEG